MKKKLLLFIHLTLGILYCSAQDLPNIIPPSPNAASLGSYGQVPVGLFTGTPQISIPLYEFKAGKLSVPISLSYSSNGIRVDEMASDVGLGWALNAGGVVTRTIMDDGDENQTPAVPNFSNYTAETLAYLQNASSSNDGFDTMADLYSFNFNGYSGTFYLDANKNPVLTNPSPVKIVNTPAGTYAFKITDPNGIIYWFGSSTSTEKIMCRNKLAGQNPWTGEEPSSWYLSKIENPSSGDVIMFNYTDSNYSYDSGLSQNVTRSPSASGSYPGQNLIINESRVLGVSLSSITSTTGKISFIYAARDLVSNTKKVESIEIEDKNQKAIKKFLLGYSIVTSSLGTQYRNPHITYEPQYGQRLFLTSVTETNEGISNPPYTFAYHDFDKIPPRFSYAQDYWGYYNGYVSNEYLVSNDDYFFAGSTFSPSKLKNIFANVGGNKKPNGLYSKNGLLKTITYPTGGFNELAYEPHSYYGTRLNYGSKKGFTISIANTADQFSRSETVTSETIPYDQDKVPLYFSAGKAGCWQPGWPDGNHVRATLTLEVAANGSEVFNIPAANEGIYSVDVNGNNIYEISSSLASGLTGQRYIDLKQGKKYRFKVSVAFECVRGDFSTSFYDKAPITEELNIEAGGQRLQRMISNFSDGKEEIKDYYYGTLSCLSCSSGIVEAPIPSITLKTFIDFSGSNSTGDANYVFNVSDILTLSSSTLYSLYTKQNSNIGYSSVIESIGVNFGAGGILHKFAVAPVEIGTRVQGYYVPGTPLSTTFDTGNEIETQYFFKNGSIYTTTKRIINNYEANPVLNKELFGYNVKQRDMFTGGAWTYADRIKGYDITKYIMRSQWHYLKMSTEELYDLNGLNPVITKNIYNYNNQTHLQLSSQVMTNSKGEDLETKYFYPTDSEVSGLPFAAELTAQNRIGIPLRTQTYKAGVKLSEQVSVYDKSTSTSNLLLPKSIYSAKFPNSLPSLGNTIGSVENKITYDLYDEKGNILQYTPEGGMPVSIIWGYNKTQPIAKIDNIKYASIPAAAITNLQSLSDGDNDNCLGVSCTEQILRNALNSFRNSFPNVPDAFISTYTYNPLVGVTSVTDPRGISTYYEYDSFGRLRFIKNKDLYVLQKYCYNYKGQQINCSDNTSTSIVLYKSTARTGTFTKTNCAPGGTGSSVAYSQALGAVTSTVSQAIADADGLTKFNIDGQAYANSNPSVLCTFKNAVKSAVFTRNNCASGGIPGSATYTVPAGRYSSNVSQADADVQAQNDITANGQIFANNDINAKCTFKNAVKSGSIARNNCAAGGTPEVVAYTVPAGRYSSDVSQALADSQAQDEINSNLQSYANANGKCTFWNVSKSGSIARNNCAAGGSPEVVTYTVPAGRYFSYDSQALADSQAQTEINNNVQSNANAKGKCTFLNVAKSGSIARNNCASGATPETVTYTVPAGRYFSYDSQALADSKAQDEINANLQPYANANGKCTFYSVAYSYPIAKDNCPSGGVGSSTLYNQPAGAVTSILSQEDANSKAYVKWYTEGQVYANAAGDCTFSSAALSGYFSKTTCPQGTISSSGAFYFAQSAGAITSKISQAAADGPAIVKFNTEGQAYANLAGECLYYSNPISKTFTKTNCPAGGVGSSIVYSLPYGANKSPVSQAQADAGALDLLNYNGLAQVQYGGTCTFYSFELNWQYTKDNCPGGFQRGSTVYYNVPYGKYQSNISQNDADYKALLDNGANGQNYANENGYCLNPGEEEN